MLNYHMNPFFLNSGPPFFVCKTELPIFEKGKSYGRVINIITEVLQDMPGEIPQYTQSSMYSNNTL